MDATIRGLDEKTFRRFKGKAAEHGVKMGVALTLAMQLFIEREAAGPAKKQGTKPPSGWKGTTPTSKEIDSLLYGE